MSLIVGFDTATADTAVAVVDGDEAVHESVLGPGPDGRPLHGPALLGAVEEAVSAAGGWEGIALIAVGVGPGSFTGQRIGVATARALAQARALPIVPVPTTSALAAGIAATSEGRGHDRLAVVDARRSEVFYALDRGQGPGEPRVCDPAQLGELVAVAGASRPLAAGEGSLRFRSEIEAAGIEVLPDDSPAHRVSARHTCRLGAETEPVPLDRIQPMYLRRPDAERWLERNRRN